MRRARADEKPHVVIDGKPFIVQKGDPIKEIMIRRQLAGIEVKVTDEELKSLRKNGTLIPQNERLY
jgi:hypothetical protein